MHFAIFPLALIDISFLRLPDSRSLSQSIVPLPDIFLATGPVELAFAISLAFAESADIKPILSHLIAFEFLISFELSLKLIFFTDQYPDVDLAAGCASKVNALI